jgi:hypothetical protein
MRRVWLTYGFAHDMKKAPIARGFLLVGDLLLGSGIPTGDGFHLEKFL